MPEKEEIGFIEGKKVDDGRKLTPEVMKDIQRMSDKKGFVSEKWERVYETIPDDGSPIRFNEIIEKTGISPTTISAALDCFCNIGYVHKERKSKKNVEYSRTFIEHIMNDIPFQRKYLLEIKNIPTKWQKSKNCLSDAQIDAIGLGANILYERLLRLLYIYAKEPDEEKISSLNRELQLGYIPLLKSIITSLIDDIGLQDGVLEELWLIHATTAFQKAPKKKERTKMKDVLDRAMKRIKND